MEMKPGKIFCRSFSLLLLLTMFMLSNHKAYAAPRIFIWNGNVNYRWDNLHNWNMNGGAPATDYPGDTGVNDAVQIPTSTTAPILSKILHHSIGSLTINVNAILSVDTSVVFTINGSANINGELDPDASSIIDGASNTTVLNGSGTLDVNAFGNNDDFGAQYTHFASWSTNPINLTVAYTGASAQSIGTNTLNSNTFGNIDINNSSGVALTDAQIITGNIILTTGTFSAVTFEIDIAGDFLGTGANFSAGTGLVNYNSTSVSQNIYAITFYNLAINNTSGGVSVSSGPVVIGGDLTLTIGTLSASTYEIDIAGNVINVSAGIFDPGSGLVVFNGVSRQTIPTMNFNNVTVADAGGLTIASGPAVITGDLTLTSGTLHLSSSEIDIAGNIFGTGSLFDPGTGFVVINGTSAQTIPAMTFNNLTINNSSGVTVSSGPVIIGADLTLSAGTFSGGSGNYEIDFAGNINISPGAAFDPGNGLVVFNGAGAQTIAGLNFYDLNIDNSSGVTVTAGPVVIGDDLTLSSGTFSGGGATYEIDIAGNINILPGAVFDPGTGLVVFNGTSAQTIPALTFYSLTINNSSGVTVSSGPVIIAGTNLTLSAGTLAAASYEIDIAGNFIISPGAVFDPGTGTVVLNGSGDQNLDGFNFYYLTTNNLNTINITSGPLIIGADLTLSAGTLAAASYEIDISGNIIILPGAIFDPGTGSVVFDGNSAQTIPAMPLYDLTVNNSSGVTLTSGPLIIGADLVLFSGTLAAASYEIDIAGNIIKDPRGSFDPGTGLVVFNGGSAQTVPAMTFYDLTILNSSGATVSSGPVIIGADLTLSSSTLSAASYEIDIAGNIIIDLSSAFDPGTGTVVLDGASAQSIDGINFYDLTIDNTSVSGVNISTGPLLIGGDLTLTSGILAAGSNEMDISGNILGTIANFSAGTGTVVYTGTNAQTIPAMTFFNLTIFNSSTGVTVTSGPVIIGGDLTLTQGALAAGSNELDIAGNIFGNGSYLDPGTGTVVLDGTTQSIAAACTFNIVSITSGTTTVNAPINVASLNIGSAGNYANDGTNGTNITGDLTLNGNMYLTNGTAGTDIIVGGSITGSGALFLYGDGTILGIGGNMTGISLSRNNGMADTTVGSTVIFNGSGSYTISMDATHPYHFDNLVINSGIASCTNIGIHFSITVNSGAELLPAPTAVISGEREAIMNLPGAGTIDVTNIASGDNFENQYNNFNAYDLTSLTVNYIGSGALQTLEGWVFGWLILNNSSGLVIDNDLIIEDDLTFISGTVTVNSTYQMTIGGNILGNGSNFSPGASTIILDGPNTQSIVPMSFYYLIDANTDLPGVAPSGDIVVEEDLTINFGSNLNLNGTNSLTVDEDIITTDASSTLLTAGSTVTIGRDITGPGLLNNNDLTGSQIFIGRDFLINTYILQGNGSTLTFNGTLQNFGAPGASAMTGEINNLVIGNASPTDVTLNYLRLSIDGNLSGFTGSTFHIGNSTNNGNTNNDELDLSGDMTGGFVLDAGVGTVALQGVSNQTINSQTYYDLINGNSNTTLAGNITVLDNLSLHQGNFILNGHNLTISPTAAGIGFELGSPQGFALSIYGTPVDSTYDGAEGYIVTNYRTGGHFIMKTPANFGTTFPVGRTNSNYNPITLFPNANANCAVSILEDSVGKNSGTGYQTSHVVGVTWKVVPDANISTMSMQTRWNPGDEKTSFSETQDYISYRTDTTATWYPLGPTAKAATIPGGRALNNISSGSPINMSAATAYYIATVDDVSSLPLAVNIKVFLQGPFNTGSGTMNTSLNLSGYLPVRQPYIGVPWNYAGAESVSGTFFAANNNIVDWVLVELRTGTASGTTIQKRAAFIKKDGSVVDTDGVSQVLFSLAVPGTQYYIVIRHRNHLALMSSASQIIGVGNSTIYDFTTGLSKAYTQGGNPMKLLSTGVYGMWAGDANGDGQVITNDYTSYWKPESGTNGYLRADFNLDGQVITNDYVTYWRTSSGLATQVP